ncbi:MULTISPECIES: hypothetical protein [Aphanothece]|uniref:hypothetical protein n=1 Tax=Aphanothece TaxID=1121 RepID=UPI00398E7673
MVDLLAVSSSAAPAPGLHWFEPQQEWFRRRSRCAFSARHAACLRAAYTERIELLSAQAGRSASQGPPGRPAICHDAPWGNGHVRLHGGDERPLTIADWRGTVVVVATALEPRDDWSPFLRVVRENDGIRIEPMEGSAILCRVVHDQRSGKTAPHGNRSPWIPSLRTIR